MDKGAVMGGGGWYNSGFLGDLNQLPLDTFGTTGGQIFNAVMNPMGNVAQYMDVQPIEVPPVDKVLTPDLNNVAREAADAEASRLKKRKGSSETVATSMSGVLSPAPTLHKTLGGT